MRWRRSATEGSDPAEAARANVAAYEAMRAVRFPQAAAETLLAAFAAMPPGMTRRQVPRAELTGNPRKLCRISNRWSLFNVMVLNVP